MLSETRQDLRFALRGLRRQKGFALGVVLTLALAIGANTAIFSVVDAVMLRPLPYRDPASLLLIWNRVEEDPSRRVAVSAPDFADYGTETDVFSELAAMFTLEATLTDGNEPEQVDLVSVSANTLGMLGVEPAMGRGFQEDDAMPIPQSAFSDPRSLPPGVALLGHGYWQRRFGGDPGVIGRVIRVNGRTTTVVGVLPEGFRLTLPHDVRIPSEVDLLMPLQLDIATESRRSVFLTVIGRLAPGRTLAEARAELDALGARFRELHEPHRVTGIHVMTGRLQDEVVAPLRTQLLALLGAVGFLLLIACANLANLQLARSTARETEIAVRQALGARRGRLTRQLLVEGTVLAVLGGGAGLVFGLVGVQLLLHLRPRNLPLAGDVGLEPSVVAFSFLLALPAVLIFGLAPLPRAARALGVRTSDGSAGGARGTTLRNGLIVLQVAVSLVLLFGSGLMLRTFINLGNVDPGFAEADRMTFRLALSNADYPRPRDQIAFVSGVREQLAALPGVAAVGVIRTLPFQDQAATWQSYRIDADGVGPDRTREANVHPVLPGTIEALGIRMLAGRDLTQADMEGERPVALIDEVLARRWGGDSPVGRRIWLRLPGASRRITDDTGLTPIEIVGVVNNVRTEQLGTEGRESIFLPLGVYPSRRVAFVVHALAPGGSEVLAGPIRDVVRDLDPQLPVVDLQPLSAYLAEARAPVRFILMLAAVFSALALLVAALGLFSLVAYLVRIRRREIAIRMMLGASGGRIVSRTVAGGVRLTLLGILAGGLLSVWLLPAIQTLLVGVPPTDATTGIAVVLLVLGVATAACWIPAHRAGRMNPADTMRAE